MKKIEQMKERLSRVEWLQKILKPQEHITGGSIRILNTIVFLMLFVFNISDQINNNQSIIDRWGYTIPFIILALITYLIKSNTFTAIIFLFIAIVTTITTANFSDFSGSIFFIYSFHLIRKNLYGIILISLSVLSLTIRLIVLNGTIPNTIAMMFIFAYVYLIYYFLIYKPSLNKKRSQKIRNIDVINISEEYKAIIKLHCYGYSYEMISKTLGLNIADYTIRRKIREVKKDNNIKNDAQLGQWLFKQV